MIMLTETARQELEAYFSEKEKTPLRVFIASGCQGPRLALALDDPTEDDEQVKDGSLVLCIAKDLYALTGKITVDMNPMGFVVNSENPLSSFMETGGGCSSCGGGCN
jgi:Fe-S cluster assembly iron-binding protein IscA